MVIKLRNMELTNFKGIRSKTINFGDVTNVYGDNGVGKTTLFDAFFWLLFDKNSANESNFSIKTNDEDGNPIHHLTHNVTGILEVDGSRMTLSKTITEKWVKKRGSSAEEFSGHETKYEINSVPVTMSEYKKRIQEIIDEKAFMLLTNPLQFSQALNWKERREMLMKILGEVPDEDVIASNPELSMLESRLDKYTVDELLKMTKATKAKLNDDIKIIPERIKEVQLSKIDPVPVKELEKEKKIIQDRIFDVEQGLKFRSGLDEQRLAIRQRIYGLEGELLKAKRNAVEAQSMASEGLRKIWLDSSIDVGNLKNDLNVAVAEITKTKRNLERTQSELSEKLTQYKTEYTTVFNQSDDFTVCPTCNRPYDDDHIAHTRESLEAEFNRRRSQVLTEIKTQGDYLRKREKELNEVLDVLNARVKSLERELAISEIDLETKKSAYEQAKVIEQPPSGEAVRLEEEIKAAHEDLANLTDEGSTQKLQTDLLDLKSRIAEVDQQLAKVGINERADQRIRQLETELADKSDEYGRAEHLEYVIEQFIKAKVKLLESRINDHFTAVRFKLFEIQINGGISETCEALVNTNGSLVPFRDANHAGKVNAGLDIINTLTDYYRVTAPIWIDERGEVNWIISTKGQLINLYVSQDKELRVEAN